MYRRCHLYYASQSGRAKACARRVERALRTHCGSNLILEETCSTSLDEALRRASSSSSLSSLHDLVSAKWKRDDTFLLFFVSTTGDGEPPDNMRDIWRQLLSKALLPKEFLKGVSFALFCLGDRAYGPQFCAAGRKLAVRFLHLGATLIQGEPGYGDDGTPGGGCLRDLDTWMETSLQPFLAQQGLWSEQQHQQPSSSSSSGIKLVIPYLINVVQPQPPTRDDAGSSLSNLNDFFQQCAPLTAYKYNNATKAHHDNIDSSTDTDTDTASTNPLPMTGTITQNKRLTGQDWEQDTRHLTIQVTNPNDIDNTTTSSSLPYQAGDVVAILPVNSDNAVDKFVSVLPQQLRNVQDEWIDIVYKNNQLQEQQIIAGVGYKHWPKNTTLRQWLTYCADIAALPEREDLWAISHYCSPTSSTGKDQREKLQSLSDTTASALYTDYILRQKRTWADVLYDFDSLRHEGSLLTLPALISLLAPIRPREFSIASAPSLSCVNNNRSSHNNDDATYSMDLTVAVVQGTTSLGRSYQGLCSNYLAQRCLGDNVRLWIRPGSFTKFPYRNRNVPILYMGSGTGIAPLRGLVQERVAHYHAPNGDNDIDNQGLDPTAITTDESNNKQQWTTPDILLFGCRKESADFYYKDEWKEMVEHGSLTLMTAFSRDQWHKFYVQQRLRQDDPQGEKILHHLVQAGGHLYIAGGAKMARAVKDEIVELLDPHLGGKATQFLAQLQRAGRFRVEAWS